VDLDSNPHYENLKKIYIETICQLHAPDTMSPKKKPPVPITLEIGRVPETFYKL
jgi:hypothetical protein